MSSERGPTDGPLGRVPPGRPCPIADSLEVVGDRWAMLALRELLFGVTRFNDIQANTGAPRASLSARLRSLESAGLVERRRYSERPPRDEYVLTAAGAEIGPALGELWRWGAKHVSPELRGEAMPQWPAPPPAFTR